MIRYENFITALQYFGFAKSGIPYMGVGRNLSYRKALFTSFTGFEKNKNLLSGDDDLFVNAVANAKNVEICIDKDAFTYSNPEESFSDWLKQKKRHLRSGFHYKLIHQLLLFLFTGSLIFFYALFVVLLWQGTSLSLVSGIFFGIIGMKLLLSFRVFEKLGQQDLRFFSPVLDLVYAGYLVALFFLLLLQPKDHWKT
ncbi:MAG: hypothetical protein IPP77_10070 [Bacteroidetes bacterium]|nr:hypothetical protein [Bacteroidota bacterium]